MKRSSIVLGLVIMSLAVACGGGGGSSSTPPGPLPSPLDASFSPSSPTPPADSVTLQQGSANGDMVTVQVRLTQISGVYGAAFEIDFDGTAATFIGSSPGDALEQGGYTPVYSVVEAPAGTLVVAVTRSGNAPGANVTASRTLVNLTFRVRQEGSFPVSFYNSYLRDDQLQTLPGVSWSAGSLVGI